MNNLNIKKFKTYTLNINEHPYFLVTPSIIPFLTSISIFFFVTEIINFFYCLSKIFILILSFLTFSFILFEWFFNVALESFYHTKAVQYNNKIAFMLFISTEVMFFFSLFWTFFHGSLAPAIAFDNSWPPKGINIINAFGPPIWGTWILWLSSIYALYIKELTLFNYIKNWILILKSFYRLLILAVLFTVCQLCEFYLATFSFREGLYGSVFYLLTGFHGIHVVIGTIFLMICWIRYYLLISKDLWYNIFIFTNKNLKNKSEGILPFFDILFLKTYKFFKNNSLIWWNSHLNLQKLGLNGLLFKKYKIAVNVFLPLNKSKTSNYWEPKHFVGLETGIWYWQFVDIVWIFVWIIIYIWGNNSLPFSIKLNLQNI